MQEQPARKKGNQGFASMDKQRLKELTQKGGKSAHAKGVAYKWTSEQAREASLKAKEAKKLKKQQEEEPSI
jgi:general stress protein YciG